MSQETPDTPDPPEEPDPLDVPEENWADLSAQVPEGSVLLGFTGVLKYLDENSDLCAETLRVQCSPYEALGMAMLATDALRTQLAEATVWLDQEQEGPDL